jgi:hypothetical protein
LGSRGRGQCAAVQLWSAGRRATRAFLKPRRFRLATSASASTPPPETRNPHTETPVECCSSPRIAKT